MTDVVTFVLVSLLINPAKGAIEDIAPAELAVIAEEAPVETLVPARLDAEFTELADLLDEPFELRPPQLDKLSNRQTTPDKDRIFFPILTSLKN